MTTTIVDFLKTKGIDACLPRTKIGECGAKYTVVLKAESQPLSGTSTVQSLYDIMCYVPANEQSKLTEYMNLVKESMKGLSVLYMIRPTYSETGAFYDDEIKAWMLSAQYVHYHRK